MQPLFWAYLTDSIQINCNISSVRNFPKKDDSGLCESNTRIEMFHSKSSLTGKEECFHLLICLIFNFFFFFFFGSGGMSWLSFALFCSSSLRLTIFPFVNLMSKTAHPNNSLPLKTLASHWLHFHFLNRHIIAVYRRLNKDLYWYQLFIVFIFGFITGRNF